MSVHDVHVDHGAAAALRGRNLIRKVRKIRRQYRRKKFNHNNDAEVQSSLGRKHLNHVCFAGPSVPGQFITGA
jgi:hypothetical protein